MSEETKPAEGVVAYAFAADMLRLDVPPACRDGIEANLRLLADHARTLEAWLEREAPQP
jgi:hypothetical protein